MDFFSDISDHVPTRTILLAIDLGRHPHKCKLYQMTSPETGFFHGFTKKKPAFEAGFR
jgi:hypothetical protein